MARLIEFEGKRIEVPDDASDAEVQQLLTGQSPASQPQPAPAAPQQPRGMMDAIFDNAVGRTVAQAPRSFRKGVSNVLGLPADAMNNLPRVWGGQPFVNKPWLGSENIDKNILGLGGLVTEVPPAQSPVESAVRGVVDRAFQEVGASAVPFGAVAAKAKAVGVPGAKALQQSPSIAKRLFGDAVETVARDPSGSARRELSAALAAGSGAGIANNIFAGGRQNGDNFASDFGGSMAGLGAYGFAKALGGAGTNVLATLFGNPRVMDDIVQEEVANRVISNSTRMGEQAAAKTAVGDTSPLDTETLVRLLRQPSPAEQAIPGFAANIGDRSRDPGLTSFAFNQDALSPGAASARRGGNEKAIAATMDALTPQGNAGEFRAGIQASVDARTGKAAETTAEAARNADEALAAVQPNLADAAARGSTLRTALQDASDKVRAQVDALWKPINESKAKVELEPLAKGFGDVDSGLSVNEQRRFQPAESNLPGEFVTPKEPVNTGILDQFGAPVMRENPATSAQELREITGIRSGLTDDILKLEKAGQGGSRQAGILRQYRDALDNFVDTSIPAELKAQYDTARAATRDMKDRFGRSGDATADALRRREGGDYALNDSAVAQRFVPSDQGKVSDFRALMQEAGTDPRARTAVADEILSQVNRNGLLQKPDALRRWLADRSIVLDQFPELRDKLGTAGTATAALKSAQQAESDVVGQLTKPGRSPEASYLQYGDERTLDAVRSVLKNAKPREAAAQLVQAAGGDARALANGRAAFWEAVKDTGMNSATSMNGNRTWNGRMLRDFLDDPKNMAVAEELYKDAPEQLDNMKQVFSALADAESSAKARAPGSSGTAQALNGKYDPALSASSVASRLRSVRRGQLSPTIAGIDLMATWLRRRSAQMQSRAIDTLTSAVVNNPEMAADLLEKFNPADYAAKRRMLLQKYGVRATQVVNLLDEAQDPEADLRETIMGGQK